MKVMVLGMDGYLGWPTAMYFSAKGHDVFGIDNYFRRNASRELNADALIPNPNLHRRAEIWKDYSDRCIQVEIGDITDYDVLYDSFKAFMPDVVVHYAEQPSGPWSMIDRKKARLTLENNLISTLNVAYVIKELNPECHLIKLGTMGEYGTPNLDIPEGWFELEYKGKKDTALFPRAAGSLYHTTKIMDTDMLWYYVRIWKLRVTDLMQGPVYGLVTDEMRNNSESVVDDLLTNFYYDEVFGTVLNRFIVQALINYPLTVYGKGGQTRGYLNIKDTMQCIYLSAMNPPELGKLEVYNQITQTFSVKELAQWVHKVGREHFNLDVQIQTIDNPRVEKEEHYYNPTYSKLRDLGLQPNRLNSDTIVEMMQIVEAHLDNVNEECIFRGYQWK